MLHPTILITDYFAAEHTDIAISDSKYMLKCMVGICLKFGNLTTESQMRPYEVYWNSELESVPVKKKTGY